MNINWSSLQLQLKPRTWGQPLTNESFSAEFLFKKWSTGGTPRFSFGDIIQHSGNDWTPTVGSLKMAPLAVGSFPYFCCILPYFGWAKNQKKNEPTKGNPPYAQQTSNHAHGSSCYLKCCHPSLNVFTAQTVSAVRNPAIWTLKPNRCF